MTNEELKTYFADLLIIQYRDKVRARAHIKALVDQSICDQLPIDVQDAFNVDTAVGDQLDILAKYVGAQRQGYDFTGPKTLTDSELRQNIKIRIVANTGSSTTYELVNLIYSFFGLTLRLIDDQSMRIQYLFSASIGSQSLLEFFIKQGVLPKPMGVQIGAVIYIPNPNNLFSFRTYDRVYANTKGFNNYTTYETSWPWLSYNDVIVP